MNCNEALSPAVVDVWADQSPRKAKAVSFNICSMIGKLVGAINEVCKQIPERK